jgi:hypothetical protein
MATILDNLRKDTQAITRACIRKNMPPPKMIKAALCWNLAAIDAADNWTERTIASGTQKQFIKQLNLRRCKKSEAQVLMIAGEKQDGCFIKGKSKRYWLRLIEDQPKSI